MVFTKRLIRILPALLVAVALSTYAEDTRITGEDARKKLAHAMLKNTTWQNEEALDAFVVGLYGQNEALQRVLGAYMPTIEVRGKPVVVTTYESLAAAREANILLLARSENARLDEINEALRRSQTLVVTDGADDKANIMANFIEPNRRRLTFEINANNIIEAGLGLSADMLMFAGSKRDVADIYEHTEAKLKRARATTSEQQQRLNDQQLRLDEQQQQLDEQRQRLDEQGELLGQGAALEAQQAQLESNRRNKLASLEGQLVSAQQMLSESEARVDQYAGQLQEKERILAEKEAELDSYSRQVARSQEQLAAEEQLKAEVQPVSAQERPTPEQRPDWVNLPGIMEMERFMLAATGGVLLLVLALIGLTFHAYRSKHRLARQLEGKTLKPGVANEGLVQMTEAESCRVLEQAALLDATDLDKQQSEYVSLISKSADVLLGLSNNMSELSRIEAGRLELEAISFSLRDALGDTLQPLALRASEKGLELTFHIPPDIPDSLIGDPTRLRQVMDNLVSNAIKFTDSGEVAVDVQRESDTESGTEDAVRVRFEVRDTGVGIAPAQQENVFEAFARGDSSTAHESGAGLGLALSNELAQLMGSRLSVRSTPGEGSSFCFSADFQLPDGPAPAAVKPLRALVVDDNETTRMILEELLDSWGMAVTVADGGESALQELTRAEEAGDSFALALLDAVMPGMDGFELAERIRERSTQQAVRILMLTSAGQTDSGDLQRRLDISSVLPKPTKHSALLGAITDALGISGQAVDRSAQGGTVNPDSSKLMLVEGIAANRKVAQEMLGKTGSQPQLTTKDAEAVEDVAADVQGNQAEASEAGPLPAGDKQPCLDWNGALRNLDGDKDFLVELAGNFLAQYPRMLAAIEDAIANDEGDELRLAAHSLKAEAQLIGAIAAAETASRLENLGHMGEVSDAAERLGDLQNNLAELKTALSEELSEQQTAGGLTQNHQA